MKRLKSNPQSSLNRRTGAVLMEVLIAVLAMGIGVVSLMSLFPLSVVRTAQAHQLTVGTGLRLNAEEVLDCYPSLWIDPDNDGNPVLPNADPYYLVDPLGVERAMTSPIPTTTIQRYSAGFTGTAATDLAVYSGNWIERYSNLIATAPAPTPTTATLPGLSAQAIVNSRNIRLVIYEASGKTSQVRRISETAIPLGNPVLDDLEWDAPLPTGFVISRIRVESSDEQFSWMLTCRRTDAGNKLSAELYLAVFFRREFSAKSEEIRGPLPPETLVFKQGVPSATIRYLPNERPAIRRGGYVLDSQNGYWYRVDDYSEDTNAQTITMSLEYPAQKDGNGAIFFKGLVDVYYLGPKEK